MSSWLRPTKFHHITNCSENGVPPSNSTRPGVSPALRSCTAARPGPRYANSATDRGFVDMNRARIAEQPVFEVGVEVEVQLGAGAEIDLGADQRRESPYRRTASVQLAEKHPRLRAG